VLATRERDLEDARSVLDVQRPRLDDTLIRTEIQQLVEEIPDHDIRGRFRRLSEGVSHEHLYHPLPVVASSSPGVTTTSPVTHSISRECAIAGLPTFS
jgi:hypothetical protein